MANIVPVKSNKKLKLTNKLNLNHIAQQHIVPLTVAEYAKASSSFPIVIAKDPDSQTYRSIVMLGLENGENLIYKDEKWSEPFVPFSATLVPFVLGVDPEKERTLTTCVDLDSPFVGEDKDVALFDDEGNETEILKNVYDSLGRLYDQEVMTDKFIREMHSNDLLQELEIIIQFSNKERKKLVGLYTVNEEKIKNLSDEKVLDFYKRGMFVPLHAMLASLGQIHRLVKLRNLHSEVKIDSFQIIPLVKNSEAASEAEPEAKTEAKAEEKPKKSKATKKA